MSRKVRNFFCLPQLFFWLDGKVVLVRDLIYFEECDRIDICLMFKCQCMLV